MVLEQTSRGYSWLGCLRTVQSWRIWYVGDWRESAFAFSKKLRTDFQPPDSNMARDSFSTFIPLSVENPARSQIIFDYFELLSAMAAHGKTNGFGGRKLSRMAAWWAFEHKNLGAGFEGGYKSWLRYDARSKTPSPDILLTLP